MASAVSSKWLRLPLLLVSFGLSFDPDCPNEESSSLLQSRTVVVRSNFDGPDKATASSRGTCSVLKDQGGHFTVGIEVGTPPQRFDVVADTGSNAVIVSSCICQRSGSCSTNDRCFTGTSQSSSFLISNGTKFHGAMVPQLISMTFGSGKIEAAVATDVVSVAGRNGRMSESLLLMISRDLKISGPFEGILGLGLPKSDLAMAQHHLTALAGLDTSRTEEKNHPSHRGGFLEEAQIPRFSVCFNNFDDGHGDGVLRLSQPPAQSPLGAIGRAHWAVDFGGISVGEASKPLPFCSRESMRPGQQTACAAIPDSGTTLIMGPKDQITTLFSELCARWPRCMQKVTSPANHSELAFAFSEVLLDCSDWMTSSHGLDQELPPLHLHVAGANGSKRTLKLPGNGYVFETETDEVHYVVKHLMGIFPVKLPVRTGKKKRVCTPAFGTHAYETQLNGPVWIFGLPLFYEYQVGYELTSEPPGISFSEESCGSCDPDSHLNEPKPLSLAAETRKPRLLRGPRRLPSFDVNEPL